MEFASGKFLETWVLITRLQVCLLMEFESGDRLKIINIVGGVDNKSAGTSYSVLGLVDALSRAALSSQVYSFGANCRTEILSDSVSLTVFKPALVNVPLVGKIGMSGEMRRFLFNCPADLIHLHGLWMMPVLYAADASVERQLPFLISPHGMLGKGALHFSRFRKKVFSSFLQDTALNRASCFRATSEQEALDIRDYGLKQPIAVIPNGLSIVCSQPLSAIHNRTDQRYVLSLGRIHPKKGLDRLLRSWQLVEAEIPDVRLKIVGPDEGGHLADLIRLARSLRLDRVDFLEPVFGEQKMEMLAKAEVFALATLDENFALTVVESLSCGTPVISTKGAPWSGLVENQCGWWIDHGIDSMATTLKLALSLPDGELRAMGLRGYHWVGRAFAWTEVAKAMEKLYRWLAFGESRPSSVSF